MMLKNGLSRKVVQAFAPFGKTSFEEQDWLAEAVDPAI